MSEHQFRRDVHHRDSRDLAHDRHGPARARVHLDHMDAVVRVEDELDIEQPHDLQRQREFRRVRHDRVDRLARERSGRVDRDAVAGMDARALEVLHDPGDQDVRAVADAVHLDLLAEDVLVDQDGVSRGQVDGALHVLREFRLAPDDLHRAPAEDVGGTDENGVSDAPRDFLRPFDRDGAAPVRKGDVEPREKLQEAFAVLRHVDALHRGSEDPHPLGLKLRGQVDRGLAAELNDHALGVFLPDDIHDALLRERFEVELVGRVEVRADGLGVVVDDDGLDVHFPERADGVDAAIVELDPLADPYRPGPDDERLAPAGHMHVVRFLVGGVEVGRDGLELARAGVDDLEDGVDGELAAQLHDRGERDAREVRDVRVAEADFLGPGIQVVVEPQEAGRVDLPCKPDDVFELADEELVDARDVDDLRDRNALLERLADREHDLVVASLHEVEKPLAREGLEQAQAELIVELDVERIDGLQQRFLEGPSDRHDLPRGLHLRSQGPVRARELIERPARHLGHDVVERRLEAGRGRPRDGIFDLVEIQSQRDLRGDARDRVAGGLRRERARAADARVDLDNDVFEALRVQRVLDIAPAPYAEGPDDPDRGGPKHLVLHVRQRLARSDDDAVARVDADGVEILHVADDDAVVRAVAHDLVLDFLPPGDALFQKHLADHAELEPLAADVAELLEGVRNASARAAERVGGAHDDRKADSGDKRNGVVHRRDDRAVGHLLPEILHRPLEEIPVFGLPDRIERGPEQLDPKLVQDAVPGETDRHVEPRLAAERSQDAVGTLLPDDRLDVLRRDGLDVHAIGDVGVRHDRRRVAVDENDRNALLPQRRARLRSGVVELRRLPDRDRTGADHQNFFDVRPFRHGHSPRATESRRRRKRCPAVRARPPGGTERSGSAAMYGGSPRPFRR